MVEKNKQGKFIWEDEDIVFDKPGKPTSGPVLDTAMTDKDEDDLIKELDDDDKD